MMHRNSVILAACPPIVSSPHRSGDAPVRCLLLVACWFLAPVAFSAAAPEPAPAAASGPAVTNGVIPAPDLTSFKSAFEPKLGKDPFFPKSRRLEAGKPVLSLPPIIPLHLKGISGTKGRRLAIINNRTFEAGEQAEFKVNNQAIRVRCIEVREQSAVISIDGMSGTQELQLNQHQ